MEAHVPVMAQVFVGNKIIWMAAVWKSADGKYFEGMGISSPQKTITPLWCNRDSALQVFNAVLSDIHREMAIPFVAKKQTTFEYLRGLPGAILNWVCEITRINKYAKLEKRMSALEDTVKNLTTAVEALKLRVTAHEAAAANTAAGLRAQINVLQTDAGAVPAVTVALQGLLDSINNFDPTPAPVDPTPAPVDPTPAPVDVVAPPADAPADSPAPTPGV